MWNKIAKFILRNRPIILFMVGIITILMAFQLPKLKIKYEYAALLPEDDPIYVDFIKFKEEFGEDANIMFIAIKDSNFFQVEKINDWLALEDSLRKVKGITEVASALDAVNILKDTTNRRFRAKRIFDKKITSQSELNKQVSEFKSIPFYEGMLYNDTANVYVMVLSWDTEVINSKKREKLMDQAEAHIKRFQKKYNAEIHISGLPYTRTRISEIIKKELFLFIYLAALVTALILYFFFRSFKVVTVAMLIVGIGAVWALGSMVLFGYEITILTGMIPPLLIVIGIPNSVYLLNKYHYEYKRHGNKIKALHRVITKVGNATFLTNLTTAAGFATFILTNNTLLLEFGVIASLNIMGVFVLSITLIPIFFSYLAPPKTRHTRHLDNKLMNKIVEKIVFLTQNKRKQIYVFVIVITLLGLYGITLMKNEGYVVDDIPHDNPIYKDLKFTEKYFDGIMPVEIVIDTRKKKGVLRQKTLERIDSLERKLESYDALSRPYSIVDGMKFLRQAYFNGNPKYYALPDRQEMSFIMKYLKGNSDQKEMITSFVDSTYKEARITLRCKDIGTSKMLELEKNINTDIKNLFPPEKYDILVTGSSIIYTQGTLNLIKNLFISIVLAILFIAIFMASMFKSLRMVFISLLPNLLPLLITAAIMGYFGIRIKPSTILVFSIAFGISVDNAIHFLAKYRQELTANNWAIRISVINALKETGVSIMYTAMILFFGFGIFILSEFGGTVSLGMLVAITLLIAMFSNLLLLPSLLLSLEKFITTKSFKQISEPDED